ncbi:unnamed protein product [Didymodactylos carnosus]|uniref:Uncharacterized protein n=1 Tax=Didymodactylos carnosus TaxID=1234261 RepID=A0A814ZPH5_9BILA|nr:unnamed protein product [Didymodactylos carnosus]CAF1244610.1 unnamed protein product [Didymodactylos carnosus]CAF3746274.1 unnamed protein product [Didymodactylos carnosus]CAF4009586.1 unnamed protein product [Didymodactylos carnosus]
MIHLNQKQTMKKEDRNYGILRKVKVLKYQDELECGRRERKHGLSLIEEVEFYRKKLMKKIQVSVNKSDMSNFIEGT